jgi:RNA-directed DNA polymerase
MALLAVGVLQPTSPREVRGFLKAVFPEGGQLPPIKEFSDFLEAQCTDGRVLRVVVEGGAFYSLTLSGTRYLSPSLRRTRDKFRMYLLRDAHRARVVLSRGDDEGLAGVSPAADTSTGVKGSAANKVGRTTFGRRFAYGQPYWPRIQRQFVTKTGPGRTPRDTFPDLMSFLSRDQVNDAGHSGFRFDYVGLGLCLSISPQLIWKIANAPGQYYRHFTLPKKGGGQRQIESPRIFLKVIQWFLADFVLDDLPVHDSVHSFAIGRSIATNALMHQRRAFVGGVDIENFFGNVNRNAVLNLLLGNRFDQAEADIVSRLVTNQNRLPQGAPTSPVIANAVLYEFDAAVSQMCTQHHLSYSRYADDITVSGDDRGRILSILDFISGVLRENHGLRLNTDKTRIASRRGQQRVAGVVVNDEAAPPRLFRRKIRATFHEASKNPRVYLERIAELGGYLGYLKMFPKLTNGRAIQGYETVLRTVRELGQT